MRHADRLLSSEPDVDEAGAREVIELARRRREQALGDLAQFVDVSVDEQAVAHALVEWREQRTLDQLDEREIEPVRRAREVPPAVRNGAFILFSGLAAVALAFLFVGFMSSTRLQGVHTELELATAELEVATQAVPAIARRMSARHPEYAEAVDALGAVVAEGELQTRAVAARALAITLQELMIDEPPSRELDIASQRLDLAISAHQRAKARASEAVSSPMAQLVRRADTRTMKKLE